MADPHDADMFIRSPKTVDHRESGHTPCVQKPETIAHIVDARIKFWSRVVAAKEEISYDRLPAHLRFPQGS